MRETLIEKATYSYTKVYQACDLVKGVKINCKRKQEHFPIAVELKKITEKCYELTNCILFEYDWNFQLQEYYKESYEWEKHTLQELNRAGKAALRYLQYELTGILTLMETGEVNISE